MTLDEITQDLKAFADKNPIDPKGTLAVTDSRYKRVIELEGYHVEVTLALFRFASTKMMYQLEIKNKDTTGKTVPTFHQYTIKSALLEKATECGGENEERRRFVLAAEGRHERCRDAPIQPQAARRQEVVEMVAHT